MVPEPSPRHFELHCSRKVTYGQKQDKTKTNNISGVNAKSFNFNGGENKLRGGEQGYRRRGDFKRNYFLVEGSVY